MKVQILNGEPREIIVDKTQHDIPVGKDLLIPGIVFRNGEKKVEVRTDLTSMCGLGSYRTTTLGEGHEGPIHLWRNRKRTRITAKLIDLNDGFTD